MYTWFRLVPRTFTLTGRVVEANTLFTAWTSVKIVFSAFLSWSVPVMSVMAKYLPLPLVAMLCSSAVCDGPWPANFGRMSIV